MTTAREPAGAAPTTPGQPAGAAPATAVWLVLFRVAVTIALLVSGALYMQYLDPAEASFCGHGSGCDTVRRSGFGYFGVSYLNVPLVGLVGYGAVLWASLSAPHTRLALWLSVAGAVAALALIGVQGAYLGAFCSLCVAVDLAAIAAAPLAWLEDRTRRAGAEPADPLRAWAWAAIAAVAAAAPMLWVKVKPAPPVPAVIRALYEPGRINVVEFADFECPFCRRFHATLKRVVAATPKEQLHFIRRHVPLEAHELARPAARAALCAEAQGKGEELADRLMTIELDPAAIRRAAIEFGVRGDLFDRCLGSPEIEARLKADRQLLEAAGMEGLPTTYVGGKRLLGAVSEPALQKAFDRAAEGAEDTGIPAAVYVPLVLAGLGALAWSGRTRRKPAPSP